MIARPRIDILLATYNGEAYLDEQLHSIRDQTVADWRLLIRDDGSTDATPAILESFRAEEIDRVRIVDDDCGNLGVAGNFSALMQASSADYVMFCDQDDVWLPDKVSTALRAIRKLEAQYGSTVPLLIHSDLMVVDRNLRTINPSFWRYQGLRPDAGAALNRLLLQNVVTGCTAIMNRRLIEMATPVPSEAVVHDWWVSLIAAAFGRIGHLSEPQILYRQHDGNVIGAAGLSTGGLLRQFGAAPITFCRYKQTAFRKTQRQAASILQRFPGMLHERTKFILTDYALLSTRNAFRRRYDIARHRFLFHNLAKNIGLFVLV